MKYCRTCILPDTRPNLELDADGVCNACRSHATKREIDWSARERLFGEVVAHAQSRSCGYDCVIPVSGGKDSTWQVVKCLEYGLHPLAITWKTPGRTPLGARNLENLVGLGVDHIDYQINPRVERKFMLMALERFGSTAVPMHMAIFNIPLTIAARFDIPLVIWGENSAFEYGGLEDEAKGFRLDAKWIRKFGVTHGTCAADWIGENLTRAELTPYVGPTEEELNRRNILAAFLGYYFQWSPQEALQVARAHGFSSRMEGPRTGHWNYADIDDDFISIHHWLKWYKFGFTRTFDNLSIEIRNGQLSRVAALEILRERGDETPHDDITKLCAFLSISEKRFYEVAECFRNRSIWVNRNGQWMMPDFLVSDWDWR